MYKESFYFQVALSQLTDITLLISVFSRRGVTGRKKEMIGWISLGTFCGDVVLCNVMRCFFQALTAPVKTKLITGRKCVARWTLKSVDGIPWSRVKNFQMTVSHVFAKCKYKSNSNYCYTCWCSVVRVRANSWNRGKHQWIDPKIAKNLKNFGSGQLTAPLLLWFKMQIVVPI